MRKGRAALFADCGLGKTPMQLVWAENVSRQTGKPVLIVTPLARVSYQTEREAAKFGIEAAVIPRRAVTRAGSRSRTTSGCTFRPARLRRRGLRRVERHQVLRRGPARQIVTDFMRKMPYRLLCTATAAPNDYIELGTSSEALGYLGHMDMLGRFFMNKNDVGHQGPSAVRCATSIAGSSGGSRATPRSRSGAGSLLGAGDAPAVRPRLSPTTGSSCRRSSIAEHIVDGAAAAPRARCSTCRRMGMQEEREEAAAHDRGALRAGRRARRRCRAGASRGAS